MEIWSSLGTIGYIFGAGLMLILVLQLVLLIWFIITLNAIKQSTSRTATKLVEINKNIERILLTCLQSKSSVSSDIVSTSRERD